MMPTDDVKPHVAGDCECGPSVEAGGRLVVHQRFDGNPLVSLEEKEFSEVALYGEASGVKLKGRAKAGNLFNTSKSSRP